LTSEVKKTDPPSKIGEASGLPPMSKRERLLSKRRLSKKDKDKTKNLISRNNNTKCYLCGKWDKPGNLDIVHKNGNLSDNRLENLTLAHHVCNVKACVDELKLRPKS